MIMTRYNGNSAAESQHIQHENSTYLKFNLFEHSNLDDEILRNDT